MKDIYQFTNYRKFLKEYYLHQKKVDSGFSYRVFAKKAGFSSPNFLKLVMDGKKNMGKGSITAICNAIGLNKKESEYFSYLVFFDQAKTTVDKNYYFGLIASFRTPVNVEKIKLSQFDYYNQWYNCVVREIAKNKPGDIEPSELAKMVKPQILPKQVKKSLKLLEELGLVVRKDGKYVQSSAMIETDRNVQSLAIKNYHIKMIELAGKAVEEESPEKRNVSSVTIKISERGYNKIQNRIAEFREELMQIVSEDEDVDRVYQLNFQLFPVSKEGC